MQQIVFWIGVYIAVVTAMAIVVGRLSLKVWKHPERHPVLRYILFPGITEKGNYHKVGVIKHAGVDFPLLIKEVCNALDEGYPNKKPIAEYLLLTAIFLPFRGMATLLSYTADMIYLCAVVFFEAVENVASFLAKHFGRYLTIK